MIRSSIPYMVSLLGRVGERFRLIIRGRTNTAIEA
jgi:hypothetical protein